MLQRSSVEVSYNYGNDKMNLLIARFRISLNLVKTTMYNFHIASIEPI